MTKAGVRTGRKRISRLAWVITIVFSAGVMMRTEGQALATEIQLGGHVTLSERRTDSDAGQDSEQTELTTTLQGLGYIWRPWFATTSFRLNLSGADVDFEQEEGAPGRETKFKLISGDARLRLFPVSRFPLEVFANISDSRIENETVGIPLDEINTLRQERYGLMQSYRPPTGNSNYSLQYFHTRILEDDTDEEKTDQVALSAGHRIESHSFNYGIDYQETFRDETDSQREDSQGNFSMRHGYRPGKSFNLETSLDVIQDTEEVNSLSILDSVNKRDDTSALATFLTYRPENSDWTVRARMGAQQRDSVFNEVETNEKNYNGSASVSYDITRSVRVTGDAGFTRTRVDENPEIKSSFQEAAIEYAPAPLRSGKFSYQWNARASAGKTDANNEETVRTTSIGLSHGLNRISSNGSGRTDTFAITQAGTRFRNSLGTDLRTVNHLSSATSSWSRTSSTSRAQISLDDTRIKGEEVSADTTKTVNRKTQAANILASHEYLTTRFSVLEGEINLGSTFQDDSSEESLSNFARVSTGYTIHHAFVIDRLRFRSRLEYSLVRTEVDFADQLVPNEKSKNRRASWDNRFDYIVGLLTIGLRRSLTQVEDKRTRVTVLSATRRF